VSDRAVPAWLDPQSPHDPDDGAARVAALLRLLGPTPRRVLELGCGAGRVAEALVEAGHDVTGLDRDEAALAACAARTAARLVRADFRQPWPLGEDERFDAVCCLGNTFMLLAEVEDAVVLLARSRARLAPGGIVVLDDVPADFWPELADGRWQNGVSEDGSMQIVWAPDDAVFTLRVGDEVDAARWTLDERDARYRLWTRGALALAAKRAGLSDPVPAPDAGIVILRRIDPAASEKTSSST
jgi:SAM-dependent methyltransferase